MSYLVLARKWRPQKLEDVLGQEHVTRTLTNALTSGRIAHAFLFTGARGVGKTSAARILAKALCCEAQPGPTPSPCGVCTSCVEIAEGRATDVFEIDAASNRGIANVQEIIGSVRYLPSKARFKIFIVDEVHMLTTEAFNALLKTLEEPPPHVKFILATTDVHKVPVTILSRCQRYDFRRIALSRVAERLSAILSAEGIEHEPSAMMLVARESEGSMRDAQSLLEQVLSYAGGAKLEAPLVRAALGVADRALLADTTEAILGRNPARTLEIVKEVHDRGFELKRFGDAIVEYARDLLVAKLVQDPAPVLDRPKDEVEELVARAKKVDAVTLERLFDALAKLVDAVSKSPYPRFALEVGLASLAETPPRVPIEALVEQLDRVESMISAAPGGAAGPRPFPRQELKPPKAEPPPPPSPPPSPPPPVTAAPPPPPVEEAPAPAVAGDFAGFVALVAKRRPTLSGSLTQVRPLTFAAGKVTLGCETAFDVDRLSSPDAHAFLSQLAGEYLGGPVELVVTRLDKKAPAAEDEAEELPQTLDEVDADRRKANREMKEHTARESPAIKRVSDVLGGKITRVRAIDDD